MTDEELDVARANEAIALTGKNGWTLPVAIISARLAREGWTPPDPLEAEVDRVYHHIWSSSESEIYDTRMIVRKALERGIEIGRGK